MEKERKIIAAVLGGILIIMFLFLVFNWNDVFAQRIEIVYPDGCIEEFKNGVATTPICTNGRLLKQEADSAQGRLHEINKEFINVSVVIPTNKGYYDPMR